MMAAQPVYYNPSEESYSTINENGFKQVGLDPLSTFSIDVDKASYTNIRRFINEGQVPPQDAVRIEEMVNYFEYQYPQPTDGHPFSINAEYAECPWQADHKLLQIGLQGKKIATENLPASNLVFLLDVSGSMDEPNKLPLVKSAFKLLVNNLREQDRVAIVVYAGAAGVVLEPTKGSNKNKIIEALNNLQAGGSTAGGAGIELAYKLAKENFIKGGNNRVLLATDGDFNVGISSEGDLERMIENRRQTGIFLTCLGFGMGNYKDSKLEVLADKGNGNYAYIDDLSEATRVFVNEFGGTLFTIAKDVKIQIEFNPNLVQAYRLIGYENRLLNNEDFKNDAKDAGELGSGHTVTAIYEIIPVGVQSPFVQSVDELKYQKTTFKPSTDNETEVATVKFRYKKPDGDTSIEMVHPIENKVESFGSASENIRFASSVAMFGMVLRNSEFKGQSNLNQVIKIAENARQYDPEGYRGEFLRLVKTAKNLDLSQVSE
jgi:Ca-activated chloride channel family protein